MTDSKTLSVWSLTHLTTKQPGMIINSPANESPVVKEKLTTELHYVKGSIFDCNVQAIVNPVNCLGVSGAGLAKAFKLLYPDNHELYKKDCKDGLVKIGQCFLTLNHPSPQYIINFPTKQHYNDPSELEYIKAGMVSLIGLIDTYKIKTIAIPALGCGLGQLNFEAVLPLIVEPIWAHRGVSLSLYLPTN